MFDKNIKISGKHSFYMDELKNKGLFKRHLDIYIHSAIIGFHYGRVSKSDKTSEYSSYKPTNIFLEQIMTEINNLEFVYRLVMLLHEADKLELDERIKRAFRDDSLDEVHEQHKNNMLIFNSYVLGGIEVFYEKIIEQSVTELDYLKKSYEFMKEHNLTMASQTAEDFLNDL